MPVMLRRPFAALALSGALLVSACGGEEDSAQPRREQQATPAEALDEISRVRAGLDEALASLKAGDRAKAGEALAESYLEHFEKVEGPLDRVDHELNEQLEEAIGKEIRGRIKDGASTAEIRRMIDRAKTQLDSAEQKLR